MEGNGPVVFFQQHGRSRARIGRDGAAGRNPRSAAAIALVGLVLAVGCRARSRPDQLATPQPEARAPAREIWEVAYVQGVRVGYARTTIRHQSRDGQERVCIDAITRLAMRRFNTPIAMDIRSSSLETPDGQLLECEAVIAQGGTTVTTRGRLSGKEFQLELSSGGKTTRCALPWSPEIGGFHAVALSLARAPMTPGQKRTVRNLELGSSQIATTELFAQDLETVHLLDRSAQLLRIDTTTMVDGQTITGAVWIDPQGQIWKSRTDLLQIEMFRTTQQEALRETGPGELDLAASLSVHVDRPLDRPHQTRRVRYRVDLEGGNPAEVFAAGPSQQVRPVGPHSAEITVVAIRPGTPADNPAGAATKSAGSTADDAPPGDKEREPNNWIQSDHPQIVAAAQEAAGNLADPWQAACALERYAHRCIRRPGFAQAFDTAADVLASGEGDCTEHAVLLAALARARGIPARVAIGLVYQNQQFLYHMWTELYVAGRWIPMDATLAQGGIGAAHLKITHSSLAGASALSCFLPVAQVAGRLKIEILEAF